MIEYHIQQYIYASVVALSYKILKLRSLSVIFVFGCIARIGSKEADGIISPIIYKISSVAISVRKILIKFKHRHQLQCRHSQPLEIWKLFYYSGKSTVMLDT